MTDQQCSGKGGSSVRRQGEGTESGGLFSKFRVKLFMVLVPGPNG